ncbi:F-box/WD repeat-containing protein 7-like [Elysia marginata]|uniref:F-box/WD repeat-containing protein 7-like n=1 Tax=Elysia marginata TaxID=1093978 RepID=A0AAV4FIZ2_9GAST|nr:F-box/WD repeat-containing protein 7-like [Elysia marginata]
MDERGQQEKQLTGLNSSASVSDLSEALSDMSLSTSPGSGDMIAAQDLSNLSLNATCEREQKSMATGEEVTTPTAAPRKRLVVRQMSSNPYLASAEMSPSDDHPLIAGSHSYAAGEGRLYHSIEAYSRDPADLYNRSNSYPLTSDCVEETDEEDVEDEEDEDEEDESQVGENRQTVFQYEGINNSGMRSRDACQESKGLASPCPADPQYCAPNSGSNQLNVAQISQSHNRFAKPLTPRVSPTRPSSSSGLVEYENDNTLPNGHNRKQEEGCIRSQSYQSSSGNSQPQTFCQQNYYGHTHHRYHHSNHHPSHQSALNQQIHHHHHHQNHTKNQELACNSVKNNKNGQKNSFQNVSSVHDASAVTNSHSDTKQHQSRTMEVNAWGHFYRQQENHYKYRRSHYSSDSEDEMAPNSSSKTQYSKQARPHFYQHFRNATQCRRSQQSPPHQRENADNKPAQIGQMAGDKAGRLHSGIKPIEFRNRFQTMQRWFSECNDSQKNLVLKGLLSICELPQLHLLSVLMSKELHHGCPSNCEDLITWLPADLATKVMSYLDPVSLCHASQVCKVWHQLADDQTLWRRFCCQTKWRLSRAAEHKQVISHMCQEGSIQWKNVFAERFRLRNNWLKGRCTVRTFEGHLQGISCVQFDDSRIVSGSSDKTIKVWNMRTNAPWSVQTLMGHHGTVRCLHLEGNRLVSGSCDTTIKVWDLSAQESWSSIACKVTMTGHTDTVRCLQADDDKVISGSYDKLLKIWDLKSGELRRTLKGHQASVLCVHFSETKIVSGSADKTIKLWNYEGSCMMTLCGHQDAVTCLMFDSTRVVSGSLDHNLKFWDIHSGQCLNTIDWKKAEGHTDVVRCLQADSWRVVSAADDKTIKVWNLETGERLVTLRNHTDGVTCLQFNDFIIVSGSYDKSVKLWDFSSC